MKMVFYGRYSDSGQSEQSIEGQRKACYEFAERNGYRIIAEYIDRATTGTNDSRPEFQRMIADSSKRQFEGIIVYQLDRFARNRYDSATNKARLKKNGVKVLSARENITDDASGVLMESVLEGMAEYFSAELSQKVKRGMTLTAEKCEFTGSGVPLGYKIVDKKFVINKEEAPIVRRIFEMYLAGNKMMEIIDFLNSNGLKTSKGNPYNKSSINRILTNRKYTGIYIYKDIEIPGGVPRIINDEIFNDAQALLAKNSKAPARLKAVEDNYLLTTKLFCGHCGCAMTGESGHSRKGKIHQYYKCVTRRNRGNCNKATTKKAYIEDMVVYKVFEAITDEKIDKISQKISELSAKESNNATIKRLKAMLKDNEKATDNLVKAVESGKAVEVFSAQIEKRQAEHIDLEAQLAQERMIRPVLSYEEVKFFFDRFRQGDIDDFNYRIALVDVLVEKVSMYDGDNSRIEIYCRASNVLTGNAKSEPLNGGSDLERLARPMRFERTTFRVGVHLQAFCLMLTVFV